MLSLLLGLGGGIISLLPAYLVTSALPGTRMNQFVTAHYAPETISHGFHTQEFGMNFGGEVESPVSANGSLLFAIHPSLSASYASREVHLASDGSQAKEHLTTFSVPIGAEAGARFRVLRGSKLDLVAVADGSWWAVGDLRVRSSKSPTETNASIDSARLWHMGGMARVSFPIDLETSLGFHVGWLHSEKSLRVDEERRKPVHDLFLVGAQVLSF